MLKWRHGLSHRQIAEGCRGSAEPDNPRHIFETFSCLQAALAVSLYMLLDQLPPTSRGDMRQLFTVTYRL
eukprot:9148740-Karenia_brevis.AAC.1